MTVVARATTAEDGDDWWVLSPAGLVLVGGWELRRLCVPSQSGNELAARAAVIFSSESLGRR